MPIYEYLCEKCNHEFEREQRITDDPVKTCPKCKGRKVKKLISQTSFVLKGGGWYSDLYASSNATKDAEDGDGKAAAKGDDSPSSKSDSKKSDDKDDKKAEKKKSSKKSSGSSGKSGSKKSAA